MDGHLRPSVHVYGGLFRSNWPGFRVVSVPSGDLMLSGETSPLGYATGIGADVRWRGHLTCGLLYLEGRTALADWADAVPGRPTVSMLHATLGYAFGH